MPDARVTIVVVPREQFNQAPVSLARMYATTRVPFDLVYVDGNSPPPLRPTSPSRPSPAASPSSVPSTT